MPAPRPLSSRSQDRNRFHTFRPAIRSPAYRSRIKEPLAGNSGCFSIERTLTFEGGTSVDADQRTDMKFHVVGLTSSYVISVSFYLNCNRSQRPDPNIIYLTYIINHFHEKLRIFLIVPSHLSCYRHLTSRISSPFSVFLSKRYIKYVIYTIMETLSLAVCGPVDSNQKDASDLKASSPSEIVFPNDKHAAAYRPRPAGKCR